MPAIVDTITYRFPEGFPLSEINKHEYELKKLGVSLPQRSDEYDIVHGENDDYERFTFIEFVIPDHTEFGGLYRLTALLNKIVVSYE